MTKKTIHLSKRAPAPIGPYSQAVRAGGFMFCSGQIPLDPVTGGIVGGNDVKAQTEQVMKNIQALLEDAHQSMSHIVKTTIFLKNMADFPLVNEIYGKYFPSEPPARSTVEVARLPKDVLVEVEVVTYQA